MRGLSFNLGFLFSGVATVSVPDCPTQVMEGEKATTKNTRVSKLHQMFIVSLVHSISYWLEYSNSKYFWRIETFKKPFQTLQKANAMKN